ncbi:MAG: oxidoreductase [Gammaproteobacteria bacterium]|nr:MAG: oxidoreductase [Gammaproteobacteria bacterium]
MKITVIGGGPGGLYFALLTKKARPDWEIEIFEQNRPDDTFGFGVVFSDETLGEFLSLDPDSYEQLKNEFAYWDDITIVYKGEQIKCDGNGFAGCSRINLLKVLQARCIELGVKITYEERIIASEIETRFADSDMILACDGIGSTIREHYKDYFKPSIDVKSNRFCWMGSNRIVEGFTYFFQDTEHGPICAHTYQYEKDTSTWVFEMSEETWQKWQFEEFDEPASAKKLQQIFSKELDGNPLILNRSMWRKFPRIYCENWYHKNIAILGDAKASAHFSVGAGSKLAMECAIGLSNAMLDKAENSIEEAFKHYVADRTTPTQILQHNADVSLAWFEHMDRSWNMDLEQFSMVVMCRAKSITYDNLLLRDPKYIEQIDTAWYERYYQKSGYDYRESRPTPMFTKFKLKGMELRNRVVMSPMAQYSAEENGNLTDWHFVHYAGHAKGGLGLMFVEMTCPSPDARITLGCPGLWSDKQESQWKKIVDFVHLNTATKICMQLGHAGRKGSTQLGWEKMDHPITASEKNWPLVSASPLAYFEGESSQPEALHRQAMDNVIDSFAQATKRANRAGFDMIEMHAAHGYLLASFLSAITNLRKDGYGGSIENRLRFPLEVFTAMRKQWPADKPMSVRISASDWVEGGITEADTFAIARAFKIAGVDLIDVSSGQTVPDQKPIYGRMFQTGFSEAIHNLKGLGLATMTVGNITEASQVNTILHTRRAELVALGRPLLWNPYFMRDAAAWYQVKLHEDDWEKQYLAGRQQAYSVKLKSRAQQLEWQQKAKPKR